MALQETAVWPWRLQCDHEVMCCETSNEQLASSTRALNLTPGHQKLDTILIWVPCGLLWLMTPVYAVYVAKRPVYHSWTSCSKLGASKLAIAFALTTISLFTLVDGLFELDTVDFTALAERLSPLLLLITFMLVTFQIQWLSRKGIHTSGLLSVFWSLLLLAEGFTYMTQAVQQIEHPIFLDLPLARLALVFFEFLLSFKGAKSAPKIDAVQKENESIQPEDKDTFAKRVQEERNPCPKENASILSLALFAWFIPKFARALKGRPRHSTTSTWDIMEDYNAKVNYSKFSSEWKKELAKVAKSYDENQNEINHNEIHANGVVSNGIEGPKTTNFFPVSLTQALVRTFLPYFCLDFIFMGGYVVASFSAPMLLQALIRFIDGKDPNAGKGYIIAVALCIVSLATNLCLEHHFDTAGITSIKIRSALVAAIYRKALRISNTGSQEMGAGQIVNMVSVDVSTIVTAMDFISFLWVTPIIIIVTMALLWQQLGASCLAGLGILLLLLPASCILASRLIKSAQKDMMKLKERRLSLTSQVLTGIKVVKLYGWELYFEKRLKDLRKQELLKLRRVNMLRCLTYSLWQASPVLVILACFVAYTLSSEDHVLNAENTFVSIAIGNAMYFALSAFSHATTFTVQGLVSLSRIRKFLLQAELERPPQFCRRAGHSIVVRNGTFTWDRKACISNINLEIKQGMLVAVVGKVGSGKSSLLSALLGEMKTLSGSSSTQGTVAYVSQQPWIQNLTLRDNIITASTMDRCKYDEVLDVCALRPDLHVIAGGDMAEIGGKGINLSGGQKQRVSLARAVYSDRDIYLLDDPLSAVDAHVGKHIFDQVIGPNGILRDKTRLLVTHGINHLPYVDCIIVMKDGHISDIGSFQKLQSSEAFVEYLRLCMDTPGDGEEIGSNADSVRPNIVTPFPGKAVKPALGLNGTTKLEKAMPEKKQLVAEEDVDSGQVKFSVVVYLMEATGCVFPLMLLVFMLIFTTTQCFTQLWLREWSQDQSLDADDGTSMLSRVGVFGGFTLFQVLAIAGISGALALGGMNASFNLHSKLLHSVLRSPMSFFDTTPVGRILNRFSRDMDAVDQRITFSSQLFLSGLLQLVSTAIIVLYTVPACWIIFTVLAVSLLLIKKVYVISACQMQRLDATYRSPLFAFFEETVTGVSSIRAFGFQRPFTERMDRLLNRSQSAWFEVLSSCRTLCVTIQVLGNLVLASTCIFSIMHKETLDSSYLGMTVSFTMQLGAMMAMCVRNLCELELRTVSVERIKEYSELKPEAPIEVPDTELSPDWPKEGAIEFQNYQTRYRPGLELVLRGLSCTIRPGEKVGVVGRTGAGKTSLTLALFRMIEAESGVIEIDGRDISKMGLHDVRRRMSIIPQDPVMFCGTLQFNLDPSGKHTERAMLDALEHAHLKTFVAALPDGLLHECGEGGGNLSVGQRQLICLARALLHKSKILVLDEATAAVDMDTDELIQSTIRTEFKNCTVITIAHRLNTVMDYDRIMVMKDGHIREFASPGTLAADRKSIFYSLAKEADVL